MASSRTNPIFPASPFPTQKPANPLPAPKPVPGPASGWVSGLLARAKATAAGIQQERDAAITSTTTIARQHGAAAAARASVYAGRGY